MTHGQLPIVIAGASMSGLRACEQLRAAGWDGPLVAVGEEAHLPYNRPPLSKHVDTPPGDAGQWFALNEFRRRASASDVEWILGTAVTGADLAAHTVDLADSRTLPYAGLVVATGLRPRRLPGTHAWNVRHVLRTVDDAAALYPRLRPGRTVVIIGGGFIGCEIAVTAHAHGCAVTVVEPQPAPMSAALGRTLGDAIGAHHRQSGIEFRIGVGVAALTTQGDGARVELTDGSSLQADLVIESIGSHPNVEWLAGNDLDLTDGVLCDETLAVVGARHVIAVGDVARCPNARFRTPPRRVEHWCMPNDTAKHAARTLVSQLTGTPAASTPFAPLPTFWSDQGRVRLQGLGIPALADGAEITAGDPAQALLDGVVVEYFIEDALVGVVTVNMPAGLLATHRAALTEATNPLTTTAGVFQ